MRHKKKRKILDRKKSARKALLRNLVLGLILHKKIKTTQAKAKAIRPLVEKMITLGKRKSLISRRHLLKILPHPKAIKILLDKIVPQYKNKKSGFTRIVKIGRRYGDGAEMAQIEFIGDFEEVEESSPKKDSSKKPVPKETPEKKRRSFGLGLKRK